MLEIALKGTDIITLGVILNTVGLLLIKCSDPGYWPENILHFTMYLINALATIVMIVGLIIAER